MVSSISWWHLLLLPVFLGEIMGVECMDVVDFVAATVKKFRAYDIRYPKKYELTNTITIISIIIIGETFP